MKGKQHLFTHTILSQKNTMLILCVYTYITSDLHLGDAHVISVDDILSRHNGNDMVHRVFCYTVVCEIM